MKGKNIFWGSFLIIAAVLIILSKLGYFADVNMIGIIISVFLVCFMIKSIMRVSFAGILFPAAFLCIIYDKPLGIEALTPWTVLVAALLGSIGLSMIFKKKPKHNKKEKAASYMSQSEGELSGEYVYVMNRFSEGTKYVKSTNLSKAEIQSSFGELTVYFDEVNIDANGAEIYVSASFGETILYLKKEWNVENQIRNSFASLNEHGHCMGTGAPVVKLTGNVSFGEVKIIYV